MHLIPKELSMSSQQIKTLYVYSTLWIQNNKYIPVVNKTLEINFLTLKKIWVRKLLYERLCFLRFSFMDFWNCHYLLRSQMLPLYNVTQSKKYQSLFWYISLYAISSLPSLCPNKTPTAAGQRTEKIQLRVKFPRLVLVTSRNAISNLPL
jgi:hypothetical protein